MRRFLENEPYEDVLVDNDANASPAWSRMRTTGVVMMLTTISSYVVLFWQAKKRRRREEIRSVANKTVDEEGSFLGLAPQGKQLTHGVFSHPNKVRHIWFDPPMTELARRIDPVGSPNRFGNDLRRTDVLEQKHDECLAQGPIDGTSDDGNCIDGPESNWTKFAVFMLQFTETDKEEIRSVVDETVV